MATPLFEEFREDVRMWTNRDSTALPDGIIERAMSFAADSSYHRLMAPPFESTFQYDPLEADDITTSNRLGTREVSLAVPSDLISIMHLRTIGEDGCVFNEKTDVRTYHDLSAERYSSAYWTRQGSNFLISGLMLEAEQIFELFYYKRLPALDAIFAVNARNLNAGVIDIPSQRGMSPLTTELFFVNGTSYDDLESDASTLAYDTAADAMAAQEDETLTPVSFFFLDTDGTEVPHWLRDENRKILLFGALGYCGRYLQDSEMIQVNDQQYELEIAAVNLEETKRKASGGNVQMHFNGRGLI